MGTFAKRFAGSLLLFLVCFVRIPREELILTSEKFREIRWKMTV